MFLQALRSAQNVINSEVMHIGLHGNYKPS